MISSAERTKMAKDKMVSDAIDYMEDLCGDDWNIGGSFPSDGSAFVCGSDGEGAFANVLIALFIKDKIDLIKYKRCGETFGLYVVSHAKDGRLTAAKYLQIEVSRFVHNIEYLCSYLNQELSLVPLVKLVDMHNQSLQFTKDYLESLIMSKPLSRLVLSTLLKSGRYDPLLADLCRFHINKTNRYGYVGIYLDEKIDNIGYISGRLLATVEYIASLSEHREPLRLSYTRFSASPTPMFPKLSMIAKKYIYTVPHLGRQIYLKNQLDLLLEITQERMKVGTNRHLSKNDQAMFAIGYKHQQEYFADESFTARFQIQSIMQSIDMNVARHKA